MGIPTPGNMASYWNRASVLYLLIENWHFKIIIWGLWPPVLLVHAEWCKSTIIICFMAMKYNSFSQSRIIQNMFQGDGLTPVWHQAMCGIQTGWCGFIYQVSLCWQCSCTNKYEQEFSTNMRYFPQTWDIDGSTQDCGNSSALALELPQSCVESSIWVQHNGSISPILTQFRSIMAQLQEIWWQ